MMKLSLKTMALGLLLLVFGQAKGQDCKATVDSMIAHAANFEIAVIERWVVLADSICLREKGPQHKLFGDVHFIRGVLRSEKDDPAGGLEELLQAKAIYIQSEEDSLQEWGDLHANISLVLMKMGRFDEALALSDTAMAVGEKLSDKRIVGSWLVARAQLFWISGRLPDAQAAVEQALVLLKNQTDYKWKTQYFQALGFYATVLQMQGKLREALKLNLEAEAMATALFSENNANLLITTGNVGMIQYQLGEYLPAEQRLRRAGKLSEILGPSNPEAVKMRMALAGLFSRTGRHLQALEIDNELVSWQRQQRTLDDVTFSVLLNNTGEICLSSGLEHQALPLIQEACDLIEKKNGRKNSMFLRCYSNVAACHNRLGNNALAVKIAEEVYNLSKTVMTKGSSDVIALLNNFGSMLADVGEVEKGLELIRQSADLAKAKFGAEHQEYALSRANEAILLVKQNKLEAARDSMQLALDIFSKSMGEASPRRLTYLVSFGEIFQKLGQRERAAEIYTDVLRKAESNQSTRTKSYAKTTSKLALLEETLHNPKVALALHRNADTLLRHLARRNFAVLSDAGREAFLADIRPELDRWQSFAWRHAAEFPEIPGLLFDDQLSQKGQLLHSARAVLASLRGDSALAERMNRWLNDRQMIDFQRAQLAQPGVKSLFTAFQLDSLARQTDLTEAWLTQNSAAFAAATRQLSWREVQARLAPDEAAVEFFHFKFSKKDSPTDSVLYGALVLRPGLEQPRFVPLFEEKQLAELLRAEGGGMTAKDKIARPYSKKALHALVWQPLEAQLAGAQRVWYAPSGLLHRTALTALTTPGGKRLLERYDLRQLGSTRELVTGEKLPATPLAEALIYACVSYPTDTLKMKKRIAECIGADIVAAAPPPKPEPEPGNKSVEGNPIPLPHTLSEAHAVEEQLRRKGAGVDIRTGYQAVEEDARQIGLGGRRSPDFLMFSTHGSAQDSLPKAFRGRFPPNNPMYASYLLMAGGEQVETGGAALPGFHDGLLTAREISDLDLHGTRLVVLSACQSGLGAAKSSEGVYGLQRAFKIAGARQVLATLWEIPDSPQTVAFVGQFCQRWLDGGDARTALRETQLDFIRRGESVQVWGAWMLI